MRSLTYPTLASLIASLLVACSGKDGGDDASTSASTGTTAASSTDPATASGSTTGPGTTSGSDATGTTTGGTNVTTTTGMTATTAEPTTTDDTSGSTSGGEACQIELPDPGECNGAPPARPTPWRRAGLPGAPQGLADAFAGAGPGEDELAPATDSEGCAFICPDDLGTPIECDLFAQDCAPGEKCNAWANDGGSSWNATRCVPIVADPDKVGEPCTVEGSGVSGFDSCEAAAMCWGVDPETNMGTCVALCTCSIDQPICTVPNTTCTISNDGVLVLCLPVCDPLDPGSCKGGEVCVSSGNDYFQCVIDASGDEGAAGDECAFLNACDPGHACIDSGVLPECQGFACCAPFCDISNPQCAGGSECVSWYEQGQAPKCFEDVGICIGA